MVYYCDEKKECFPHSYLLPHPFEMLARKLYHQGRVSPKCSSKKLTSLSGSWVLWEALLDVDLDDARCLCSISSGRKICSAQVCLSREGIQTGSRHDESFGFESV